MSNTAKDIQDNVLQIEWGNFTRSEAVEDHIKEKSVKILERAKGATNFIIQLSSNPSKSTDISKVNFELRFPKRQDLFCQSEGENLYEVIAHCKEQILRQLAERKSHKLQKRHETIQE